MRVRRGICALAVIVGTSGFAWPDAGERLVKELTAASSPRDKRAALRLLRVRADQGAFRPGQVPDVVRELAHDRELTVRLDALALLAALEPGAWRHALEDPSADVRLAASEALAGQLEPLLRALNDADARVRAAALTGLVGVDDARVLPAALAALSDPELEVQVRAARLLGTRPEASACDALLARTEAGFPELRAAVIDALAGRPEASVAGALTLALDDADAVVVLAGLRAFARRPELALPARVAELARATSLASEPSVREAAARLDARSATKVGDDTHEPAWLAALEQTALASLSREASEHVLAELERTLPPGATLATDPLMLWLPRAAPALRARIAALVERTGGPLASADVVRLAGERDATRRAAYLRLFAQARGDADLLACLDDAPDVQRAALAVLTRSDRASTWSALLSRLRGARGDELLRAFALSHGRAQQRLSAREQEQLRDLLVRTCDGDDDRAAALALRALGALDDAAARARVRAAIAEGSAGRRIAALRASIPDRSTEARAARLRAVADDDVRVASTAMVALALAGDPLPSSTLRAWLRGARWPLGPVAAFALTSPASAPAFTREELAALMQSAEPITRLDVAWTMTQRSGDEARAPLERSHAALRDLPKPAPFPAAPQHAARAVVLQDSRLIVSWPDASGLIDWPDVALVGHVNAWFSPYARLDVGSQR